MVGSPNWEDRAGEIRDIGKKETATVVGAQRCKTFVSARGPRMREMPAQWKTNDMNHTEMRGH
jgi:hypothetical protein